MLALLRVATEVGAAANWIVIFISAVIAVFVAYVGIAMYATLRASDPKQQKIRYKVFHDLLRFFGGWWHQ
jgi:predicted small integral membrane protein